MTEIRQVGAVVMYADRYGEANRRFSRICERAQL